MAQTVYLFVHPDSKIGQWVELVIVTGHPSLLCQRAQGLIEVDDSHWDTNRYYV